MSIMDVLEGYKNGLISAEEAEKVLRMDYIDKLKGNVLFDRSRQMRKNIPEVVYALSKTPATVADIATHAEKTMLISKAGEEHYEAVLKLIPDAVYKRDAKLIIIGKMPEKSGGKIGIVTAGTSDIPIAKEAKAMAEAMGVECITFFDIGVAGVHRILKPMKILLDENVDAIIVVAGMEGALPTIISSLSPVPVIGVPASTGYGMGGKGEAALLCMLQTCSPGLSIVNIDNGIGAGAVAALIAKRHC